MIDWFFVLSHAVWIIGCILALAILSIANFQALATRTRLRDQLGRPRAQLALSLAGLLFCAGMAASSDAVWQQVLWAALAIGFAAQAVVSWRAARRRA